MAGPRKVFRIEETAAGRPAGQRDEPHASHDAEIAKELADLRAMLAAQPHWQLAAIDQSHEDAIRRLASELRLVQSAMRDGAQAQAGFDDALSPASRLGEELKAVMVASEQAVQKILEAAEDIDQAANNLSASLKDELQQGLAQDIRDRVVQIFEACNYQDVSGQRIVKVLAMLGGIERKIALLLDGLAGAGASVSAPPAHGPPLPSDHGHASQRDVDFMFKAELKSA